MKACAEHECSNLSYNEQNASVHSKAIYIHIVVVRLYVEPGNNGFQCAICLKLLSFLLVVLKVS